MLTIGESVFAERFALADIRSREFGRLDAADVAYLDYTGAALHADRQVERHLADLRANVLGNPHSESEASRSSTRIIDDARRRVLHFFHADPSEYVVLFTANCSAAIKLVAESYPFTRHASLVLTADNHNSMNGIREFAHRHRADVSYIPLDAELRLDNPHRYLTARTRGNRLFGFPAQSNFSGVQHPLSLIEAAQHNGFDVLLDAASFVPSNTLSLAEHHPEFVVLSLYKLFGYPTGVGALIARRDALSRLRRPWFAGGTVEFTSVRHSMHALKAAPDGFEDGTPNFATLGALRHGFDLLDEVGMPRLHEHVARLTRHLINGLSRYSRVVLYGPTDSWMRGGTIAFNLLGANHRVIEYGDVELHARDVRVAIRGGCFCNPGAAERAFNFDAARSRACLEAAARTGFTTARFARCLGDSTAVGALRASIGLANVERDIDRLLELVDTIVAS